MRYPRSLSMLFATILVPLMPALATGQTASTTPSIREPVFSGACVVLIDGADHWGGKLWIAGALENIASPKPKNGVVTVRLNESLKTGDELMVNTENKTPDVWSKPITVLRPRGPLPVAQNCKPKPAPDERSVWSATARVGSLTETFAPQARDLKIKFSSLEPVTAEDQSGTGTATVSGRVMAAFDLNARLAGPLWLTSYVSYGTRQAAICKEGTGAASPQDIEDCNQSGLPNPNQAIPIAKAADSAELWLGFRYEFYQLPVSSAPANLYFTAGFGNLFILGVGQKALDHQYWAAGIVSTSGRFRESYVEYGRGRSEIFAPDVDLGWNRHRTEMFITFSFVGLDVELWKRSLKSIRPFVRASLDRGKGPDSLVTTFGVGFDMARLFGGF